MSAPERGRLARSIALTALLLGLALAVRSVPFFVAHGEARERPGLLFTDARSAYELRRVAVGEVQGRIPTADRFLAHPAGAEPDHGPLFAKFLTLLVPTPRRAPGEPTKLDIDVLEHRLAWAGPLVGLALVFAGMAAARRLTAPPAAVGGVTRAGAWGRGRPGAPLVAGVLLATFPTLVEHGSAGRLSVEHFTALLLVVHAGLVASCMRVHDRVDRLATAIAAGLVGGVALATSPLALVGSVAAWCALWSAAREERHAEAAHGEAAEDARRAGLLHFVCVAVGAQLPLWSGPWAAAQGSTAAFAEGSLALALGACAPFLFARARSASSTTGRRRIPRWLWSVLALCVVVAALVSIEPMRKLVQPLARALELGPGLRTEWNVLLAPLSLLAVVVLGLPRLRRDPAALHIAVLAGLAGALAVVSDAAAPIAFAALALAPALGWPKSAASRLLAWVLLLPTLVPGAARLAESWTDAEEDRAVVAALRELGARLPSPGPWTTARGAQDFGVLAEPDLALLATWHARLPGVGTPCGSWESGSSGARALSSLADPETENLQMVLARAGARYLFAGPDSAEALERRFGVGAARGLEALLGGRVVAGLRELDAPTPLRLFEVGALPERSPSARPMRGSEAEDR